MNVKSFFFALTIAVSTGGILIDAHKANALNWTVSNQQGTSVSSSGYFGQSFTPSNLGANGLGSAPTSGSAYLQDFSLGSNSTGKLYIFSSQYTGNTSSLATYSGSDLIGVSNVSTSGIYQFSLGGLLLPNVNSTYYDYEDGLISSVKFSSSNPYSGGIAYSTASPSSAYGAVLSFDLNFSANLATATAVPWNFSPESGLALGLPLFITLRMLKKRKALKNSTRELQEIIN
jgi:hypothetical protein